MKPVKLLLGALMVLGMATSAFAQDHTTNPAAPWRVTAALAGSNGAGLVAQASISHDHLLGPLGLRLAAEYGFGQVPTSITLGVLETAPLGPLEMHVGLGAGTSFEATGALIYAELLLGASYPITGQLGAYLEGRFRPYFDGTAEGVAGIAAGVQLRF